MNGVSVVTATLNEEDSIDIFLKTLAQVAEVKELIVVDDGSTDSTVRLVEEFDGPFRVRLIQREKKMGTASAQIIAARESNYEYAVIMDADMQHDPRTIEKLYSEILKGYDLVVSSRFVDGGINKRTSGRGLLSRGANFLAHLFIPTTRGVKDVMSGYFVVKRDIVADLKDVNNFYKILLYIFASRKHISYTEIPGTFQKRENGRSKVVSGPTFLLAYLIELMHYVKVEYNIEEQV